MAEPYPFSEPLALTTTFQDVIEMSADEYATFSFAQAPNIDGTNSVEISLQWLDALGTATPLAHSAPISPKDAVSPLGGQFILLPECKLQAKASADGDAVITVSGFKFEMPA